MVSSVALQQAFLEKVVEDIFEIDEPTRGNYAKALIASIGKYVGQGQNGMILSPNSSEGILSPEQISENFGVNIEDQDDYNISLRKKSASLFLREQGRRSVNVKTELEASQYEKTFKRKAQKVGNALLFTYAEILFLTSHKLVVRIPNKLANYLASST